MRSPADEGARPQARPGHVRRLTPGGAGAPSSNPSPPGVHVPVLIVEASDVSRLIPGWSPTNTRGPLCAQCEHGAGYLVSIDGAPPVHVKCLAGEPDRPSGRRPSARGRSEQQSERLFDPKAL